MADNAEIVSEFWGVARKGPWLSWLEHPAILNFVHRRVSGDPTVSTGQWFKNRFFPEPGELCLSLGCGFGGFERAAIDIGIAQRFHACDISKGAIDGARHAAAAAGLSDRIDYRVVDLDKVELPRASYDAIFAMSSAHHVSNLENLFDQCRDALKPGALLFLDEYIGPSRFQTLPKVSEVINKLLVALPPRYRYSLFSNDGSTIDRYVPSPIEHFERHDPSEAIRSQDIVPVLGRFFDIVEFRPYGGAILAMLLTGITGNFDQNDETAVALLNILATFEETLEQHGVIETDFAAIIAKPKLRRRRIGWPWLGHSGRHSRDRRVRPDQFVGGGVRHRASAASGWPSRREVD